MKQSPLTVTITATFDRVWWEGDDETPRGERGWVDPYNPWGSLEYDDCSIAVDMTPMEAAEFLVDFPGGVWDHHDCEPSQNYRDGSWKTVTAHVRGERADTVLELLTVLTEQRTRQWKERNARLIG